MRYIVKFDTPADDIVCFYGKIGKKIELERKRWRDTRIIVEAVKDGISLAQLRYFWGVIVKTAMQDNQYAGKEKEDVGDWLKSNCLYDYEQIVEKVGIDKLVHRGISPELIGEVTYRYLKLLEDLSIAFESDHTKWEVEEFYSRCRTYLGRQGIYVPLPNEDTGHWWEGAERVK